MSSPPIQYSGPPIDPKVPWEVSQHIQLLYQKLANQTQAISLLAQKSTAAAAATPSSSSPGSGGSSSSALTPGQSAQVTSQIAQAVAAIPVVGHVNNQSTATSYTTQQGDNGSLVVLDSASAIAVSLASQSQPWSTFITNQGTGTATITPTSGTISYAGNPGAASMPLAGGYSTLVAFDGTNWWAWTEPSAGGGGTITGVTAGTGLSGGGTTGTVTLDIAATAVTPGSYTNTNLTVNAEGQITAAANGSGGGSYLTGTVVVNPGGAMSGTFKGTGTMTGAVTGMAVAASAPDLIGTCGTNPVSWVADSLGSGNIEVQVTLPNIGIGWSSITFYCAGFP